MRRQLLDSSYAGIGFTYPAKLAIIGAIFASVIVGAISGAWNYRHEVLEVAAYELKPEVKETKKETKNNEQVKSKRP